jgi:hypothetical protein
MVNPNGPDGLEIIVKKQIDEDFVDYLKRQYGPIISSIYAAGMSRIYQNPKITNALETGDWSSVPERMHGILPDRETNVLLWFKGCPETSDKNVGKIIEKIESMKGVINIAQIDYHFIEK